jgi:mannose-6-phosphate isomerase-like protein (cupin superfamily)
MTELRPVVTSSSEATPTQFLATEHRLLVPAAKTGGALSVFDAGLVPAGFSPPMHSHLREHEMFIVSGGAVRFTAGSTITVVEGAGAAWLPARLSHSFEVLSDARMFVITAPCLAGGVGGDFERFVRAVSAATSGPHVGAHETAELVAQIGAAHDIPIDSMPDSA